MVETVLNLAKSRKLQTGKINKPWINRSKSTRKQRKKQKLKIDVFINRSPICTFKTSVHIFNLQVLVQLKNKHKNIKYMKIKDENQIILKNYSLKHKTPISNVLTREYMKETNILNSTAMMELNKYMTDLENDFSIVDVSGNTHTNRKTNKKSPSKIFRKYRKMEINNHK